MPMDFTKSVFPLLYCILLFIACEKNITPISNAKPVNIIGKIVDIENQLPISNAIVQTQNSQISDTTTLTGVFKFKSILIEGEVLIVAAPGYAEAQYTLQPSDEEKEVVISLQKEDITSDYYLYTSNYGLDKIFIIDAQTNSLVDTVGNLPKGLTYFLISNHDGTRLYANVANTSGNNFTGEIISIDLETQQHKIVHNGYSYLYKSPNSSIFTITLNSIVGDSATGFLGTIDPFSERVFYIDTLQIRFTFHDDLSLVFDPYLPVFYTVNAQNRLFAYDYEQKEIIRIYENIWDPLNMAISPDGKRIYVAGGPVFDLENDSVIGAVGGNHLGSLAISTDGNTLYITDPGGYWIPPVPSGKVYVFDTRTMSYTGEIDVNSVSPNNYLHTDRIIIHPQQPIAYVSGLTALFELDLHTLQVKSILELIHTFPRDLYVGPLRLVPKSE